MDTTESCMTNLFLQLGLPAGKDDIARFIREHQLPEALLISEAPFWNDGQRQFIREEWREDADWAIVVDELNEALHADAVAARVAQG
ncbi:DUF2789 domain-containing protein [Thermomonas sp. XSG]|jgi:hypothetical protein|uniref:DUF2789 domain-containing protein n=1 Tax=Thermomonas sp. XSG TaxID=2771436 RepID=UPI00086ABDEB|nr:DUF2789 domain-containing protein [Thermomonas sp. XSG]ODU40311.1 MAG: hypothetical protein ABS98_15970 [Xanthomonadaceae bacterium SCN 69-48]QNU15053.1 DUF2789 domain-containing protein [Thermomonas sp. XSG]